MQCLLNRSCLLYGVSIKGGSTVLKNTEWEYGSKELTGVQGVKRNQGSLKEYKETHRK